MAVGGTYLPPVVAQITADKDEFVRGLAEMKAMLTALSRQATAIKIVADSKPFDGKIASIRAMTDAMKLTIRLDADLARAAEKIAALKAAASGGGGVGLLALLGIGGSGASGGIFGWGAGLPRAGTAGALAGFGVERFAFLIAGIIGSAVQGMLGAGALALGGLGTMGVGMGSDMLVAKSTLTDTQAIIKAQDAYNKAVAIYGPTSRQAVAAMKAYQYQLQLLGGAQQVGVAAEIKLATAVNAMNTAWDKGTQGARAAFVNNIALPLVDIATKYIPDVAGAAQRNFTIMGQALKPLWDFLSGEGRKIFADLENVFSMDLPIGTRIFVQSLELVLRVIDRIAQDNKFGSFLQKILDYVTRLNSTGFWGLMQHVNNAIAVFHVWTQFMTALGRVFIDVFAGAAKTGTSVIQTLTGMLNQLDKWLKSVSGAATMKTLFAVHRDEILALLSLIPVLVNAIAPVYISLSIIFTSLLIPVIKIAAGVLEFLTHLGGGVGTVISFGLGLLIIETRLKAITIAIRLWGGLMAIIEGIRVAMTVLAGATTAEAAASALAGASIGSLSTATLILNGRLLALRAAMALTALAEWAMLGPVGLIVAGLAMIGVGIALNAQSQHNATQSIAQSTNAAAGRYAAFGNSVKAANQVATKSTQQMANDITKATGTMTMTVQTDFQQMAQHIYDDAMKTSTGVTGSWIAMEQSATVIMHDTGVNLVKGLIGGLNSMSVAAIAAAYGIGANAAAAIKRGAYTQSPSVITIQAGKDLAQGLIVGMNQRMGAAMNTGAQLGKAVAGSINPRGGVAGGGGGNLTLYFSPNVSITGAAANDPKALGAELRKQMQEQLQDVLKSLKGGSYMPGQGLS